MNNKLESILNFAFKKESNLFYWVIYEIENNEINIIDALQVPHLKENKYCNKKDAPNQNKELIKQAEKAFLQYKNRTESIEDAKTETLISIVTHLYKNQSNETEN